MWGLLVLLAAFNFLRVSIKEVGGCSKMARLVDVGVGGVVTALVFTAVSSLL